MAPSYSRQFLVLSVSTIAVTLTYLWFVRKQMRSKSVKPVKPVEKEGAPANKMSLVRKVKKDAAQMGADKSYLENTSPIDIALQGQITYQKFSPIFKFDEDLEIEMEQQVKSMKNILDPCTLPKLSFNVDNSWKVTPVLSQITCDSNVSKYKSLKNTIEGKEVVNINEKLSSIILDKTGKKIKSSNKENEYDEWPKRSSECNSVNKSSTDVMLIKPSLSNYLPEHHIEGLGESEKEDSNLSTSPCLTSKSDSPLSCDSRYTIYEFVFPHSLEEKLLGKFHNNFIEIENKTGVHIVIKQHPGDIKFKVCSIGGTPKEIDKALRIIITKFSVK